MFIWGSLENIFEYFSVLSQDWGHLDVQGHAAEMIDVVILEHKTHSSVIFFSVHTSHTHGHRH